MKSCTYELGEQDDVILVSVADMNNVGPSSMKNLFGNHIFSRKDPSTFHTPNVSKSGTFEHITGKHNSRVIRSYMLWVLILDAMPILISFHDIHESSNWCHEDYKNQTLLPLVIFHSMVIKIYQCYSENTIVIHHNYIMLGKPCNPHIRQYPICGI